MIIITSGYPYIDIDAYACMIAYAELLRLQGEEAAAVSTAPLNESISEDVVAWRARLETQYTPSNDDEFILVDTSDQRFFEKFVNSKRIVEVIDHHPGYDKKWRHKLEDGALIEPVGASATQIYEKWQRAGLVDNMSQTSARLLVTAILDNTLNFGAIITSPRDKTAYRALLKIAGLPPSWPAHYFTQCQAAITKDLATALANDTKQIDFQTYLQKVTVAQLVVWDVHFILEQKTDFIKTTLAKQGPAWFLNLVCVKEQKSYFFCQQPEVRSWLENLLTIRFKGDIAVSSRLWLRKEIIAQDIGAK